jgi:tetratricopeptide (TPR) repeat protein
MKRTANKIIVFAGSIITFLLTLAPSCPSKSPEGYFYDGKTYSNKKEYLKAYRCFTRAIKINPSYSQAYWERATTGIKIDSIENSIDDFTMFISISKNVDSLSTAYFKRAEIEFKAGYKSDACDDWNTSCELNGSSSNKSCTEYRLKCK